MHEFDGKYAKVIAVIIISVLAGILIVACTNAASSKHESNLQEIAAESNFVSYDESRNIAFYNNRITVIIERGSENEIDAIADKYKAEVERDTADVGIYALVLPDTYSYDQLSEITQELTGLPYVESANIEVISKVGNDTHGANDD